MAEKMKSSLANMFIVLTLICLISAAALGFTYTQTADRIDDLAEQRRIEAIRQVLPEFDNNPAEEAYNLDSDPRITIYPATLDGESVGAAVQSYSDEGYSGTITVMVGFEADGTVHRTSVLSHLETPGLGAKMTEEEFQSQVFGLDPEEDDIRVSNDGGEVDSITAATITSRAFCDAVRRAHEALQEGGA
ncbi:MAG: RnfABCDGE type electron transport complex subunit G [Alkalispirochaetaceae bacterium]